jgi:hypothetical protein
MSTFVKRAAFVIAVLVAFTIWGFEKRLGLILSGHSSPMMIGFVAVDAFHRLVVLTAASVGVGLISYGLRRLPLLRTPKRA